VKARKAVLFLKKAHAGGEPKNFYSWGPRAMSGTTATFIKVFWRLFFSQKAVLSVPSIFIPCSLGWVDG
jgi:hypothetical protein